ncbi:DNA polymerase III subunit delta' [Nordella sp. HKS 07]|uniref:DNA polymerase III subunit delta' n=1 Tax=Nordella sp. HKS 07 TaxID=2712222 RepID=UPI0013E11B6E|nr:DNA polymerase III subunit delta' [Nordella sp. HKS 07]QIG51332.1 DNA polymerase III subunit delta' [Nordella sp. HKS 07]
MSDDAEDPREGPLHPRRRTDLKGHQAAEETLLRQYRSGRMHHGWLFAGPRGIGKATLAYRLARFLLSFPDPRLTGERTSLYIPAEAPVAHRIASRGHADLISLERAYDAKAERLKSEIAVDDVRKASAFFGRTAGEGGWRICIVDAAEDLNTESANALLKILEEPPARSLFILVSHQAGRLLPTIRSRCLRLDLSPLREAETIAVLETMGEHKPEDLNRAAQLSKGSPGRALELLTSQGAKYFDLFRQMMSRAQRIDLAAKISIADGLQGRDMAEDYAIFCELLLTHVADLARRSALAGEGAAFARAHEEIGHSIRLANALNLDRRQTILDALTVLGSAKAA